MIDKELDLIRPRGSVGVRCEGAGCRTGDDSSWVFWVDALDPRLPMGHFVCSSCEEWKSLGAVRYGTEVVQELNGEPSAWRQTAFDSDGNQLRLRD